MRIPTADANVATTRRDGWMGGWVEEWLGEFMDE